MCVSVTPAEWKQRSQVVFEFALVVITPIASWYLREIARASGKKNSRAKT